MNAWILLHTPDLPWEKHNLIIFNIHFHYAFALLITGTIAIRNIGKNKYWDVIPTFSVMSSEQDASSIPDGSHLMAFTSFCKQTNMFICCWRTVNPDTREWVLLTVCPWKDLSGRSLPRRHTWMHMSVLQEAKVLLFCQSTSSAGAARVQKHHLSFSSITSD